MQVHLQYNEKERTVENIAFDPRQPFNPCQNFMDPRHLRHLRRIFSTPRLLRYPRQNLTHVTHEPTHSPYARHPWYLVDSHRSNKYTQSPQVGLARHAWT